MLSKIFNYAKKARETGLLAVLGANGSAPGIASLGALLVSGADAGTFLHSQLTNEVNALKPGDGNLSARVTRTGTLVRHFSLHCISALPSLEKMIPGRESRDTETPTPPHPFYMLLLEREGIRSLQTDLEKYAIAEDVQFEVVTERFDWIILQGPQAPVIAEMALGSIGEECWSQLAENSVRCLPGGALGFTRSLTGDPGFILAIPREGGDLPEVLGRLRTTAKGKDVLWLEGQDISDVLEVLRIEAGIVRIGPDAPEGKLVLPETGLEQQVVSYSKGCYLGQEVIARIRTYGSVPYVLRGLVLEMPSESSATGGLPTSAASAVVRTGGQATSGTLGSNEASLTKLRPDNAAGGTPAVHDNETVGQTFLSAGSLALKALPDMGSELFLEDGRQVGTIVSRTFSPILEAPVAFAFLDREHRTPGVKLKLKDKNGGLFNAQVALLPFYYATDTKTRVNFLHDRAIHMFADQKDELAIELLEQTLRLDPSFSDAYEALGVILGRSGRFHAAIDIFKRLEEVAPHEPMVHTNLSLYYMKLGDKQAAEDEKAKATVKQFSRFGAMKKDEQRAAEDAQKKKADALLKKQMFEEVLEIDSEDPVALFGLGNALSNLADWSGAELALARACQVQKDNSAAFLAHGKALEMLNKNSAALSVYRLGMAVASKKGDLMPLKEMERRVLLLGDLECGGKRSATPL